LSAVLGFEALISQQIRATYPDKDVVRLPLAFAADRAIDGSAHVDRGDVVVLHTIRGRSAIYYPDLHRHVGPGTEEHSEHSGPIPAGATQVQTRTGQISAHLGIEGSERTGLPAIWHHSPTPEKAEASTSEIRVNLISAFQVRDPDE
jgi:hypothetical protein